MKAEVNYLESKSKAASDSGSNQDDELKRLADSLEKLK